MQGSFPYIGSSLFLLCSIYSLSLCNSGSGCHSENGQGEICVINFSLWLYCNFECFAVLSFSLSWEQREPTLLFSRNCNWRVWAVSRMRNWRICFCSHTAACFLPLYFICWDLASERLSCLCPSLSCVLYFLSLLSASQTCCRVMISL